MADDGIAAVRQLLGSIVGADVVETLADDDPFFERGVIDSLRLVEMVDRFQSDFGIAVDGEDLSPENFGSIAGMAAFLSSKRIGQPSFG